MPAKLVGHKGGHEIERRHVFRLGLAEPGALPSPTDRSELRRAVPFGDFAAPQIPHPIRNSARMESPRALVSVGNDPQLQ
jgi:hypothetical protein